MANDASAPPTDPMTNANDAPPSDTEAPGPAGDGAAETRQAQASEEPVSGQRAAGAYAAQKPEPDQESLRRAFDELEATKRRLQRDAKRQLTEQRDKLLGELLPVVDNLDRSLESAAAGDALAEGVGLVRKQLMGVLEGYGLERLDAVGRRFDPHLHDAIATIDVDDPRQDGVVVDEWQPGYSAHGRVLRAAKVRVGKLASR